MKNMQRSLFSLAFAGLAFGACKQNPYPGPEAGRVVTQEDKARPVAPAFSVEVAPIVTCLENKPCPIPVLGHVPEGGKPVLRFEGLPAEATYDAAAGVINYTPSYNVVDVSADPTATVKNFEITAFLRMEGDTITTYAKKFSILVKNVYRPITVTMDQSAPRVIEGSKLTQVVRLACDDFPKAGDLTLSLKNAPAGTTITPVVGRPNEYRLEYTPTHFLAGVSDQMENGRFVKRFDIGIVGTSATGYTATANTTWTIIDERLTPFVSAPTSLRQGPVVNFTIRAEDLNGERPPIVTLDTNVPFGRLNVQRLATTPASPGVTLPSSLYQVTWEDIPSSEIGRTRSLTASVCGPSSISRDALCVNQRIDITFTGNMHLPPQITRGNWPVSQIQYARKGVALRLPLTIRDAEIATAPVDVQILPADMARIVSYSNGTLTITPTTEGPQQFTIKATSQYSQSTFEGFLLDVLPANWAETVILAGDSSSKEVTDLQKYAPNADVLSGAYQLSERNLKLRKTLVLTTASLSLPSARPAIEAAAQAVPNILILSPLVGSAGRITEELRDLRVNLIGRLAGQAPRDFVLTVASGSNLDIPSVPVGLMGTETAESGSPFQLDNVAGSNCRRLFSLQKAGMDLPVGVACKRRTGGAIVALGFEFSDLAVTNANQGTVSAWFDKLTKLVLQEVL